MENQSNSPLDTLRAAQDGSVIHSDTLIRLNAAGVLIHLNEDHCKSATQLYAEGVEYCVTKELPFSDIRVKVGRCLRHEMEGVIRTFVLVFDGLRWSVVQQKAPVYRDGLGYRMNNPVLSFGWWGHVRVGRKTVRSIA